MFWYNHGMKRTICAIMLTTTFCLSWDYDDRSGPPSKEYAQVWADEFDGDQLDLSKWGYRCLGKRKGATVAKESVRLDGDGHLVITTSKVGEEYRTGMIATQGKFETAFGYFECRVKFQRQQGHWSAFWLQTPTMGKILGDPKASGTEIDIYEYLCRYPNILYMNLHWDGYGKEHKTTGGKEKNESLADGQWHIVGLEWTPEEYRFFLDGKETWRTTEAVSHAKEYIILSMEIDSWGGDISKAKLPDSCMFDYVRVYKKK